jgi:hypothetical protein
MARIRTVKPEFFRHELLQDLEIEHPGQYPMFVFAGLWGHCDSNGVFPWKPKQLKLDILPFLPFDMTNTLEILLKARQILKGVTEEGAFGFVPTFRDHQRITGKEATDGVKYPFISEWETLGKHQGNNRDELESQEGKGREEEKEREEEGVRGNGVSLKTKAPKLSDEEWLESLKSNPAYKGLDIEGMYHKMIAWCEVRGKKPTRARLLNWLNREEKPMTATPKKFPVSRHQNAALDKLEQMRREGKVSGE